MEQQRRREIEESLLFAASDLAGMSRRFWAAAESKNALKPGESRGGLKRSLLLCCIKVLQDVAFLSMCSGVSLDQALKAVKSAYSKQGKL